MSRSPIRELKAYVHRSMNFPSHAPEEYNDRTRNDLE